MLVDTLTQRIKTAVEKITIAYEIILVEDGSPDNSWQKIKTLCFADKKIKGISLQKNFGQHAAIKAGLDNAHGDWIVVMDCDLQDVPEHISDLYAEAQKGFDAVFALRKKMYESPMKKLYSYIFYKKLQILSGIRLQGNVANFGIYSKVVIEKLKTTEYKLFFFPLAVRKAATHTSAVETEHAKRLAGKTSYSFVKALQLGLKVIFANSIFSFAVKQKKELYHIAETINDTL